MRQIVVVSTNDADDIPTSKVHFARLMAARGDEVFYVESLGMRRARFTMRDFRRMARRLSQSVRATPPTSCSLDGVKVISPVLAPSPHPRWNWINGPLLRWQLERAGVRLSDESTVVLTYLPQVGALLGHKNKGVLAFFMVDDYLAGEHVDQASILQHMKQMANDSDVVIASSKGIADGFAEAFGRSAHVVRNGAEVEHFLRRSCEEPSTLEGIARPRIVYVGALENWVDVGALEEVADARPDWHLVLAGPIKIDISALLGRSNVHYLGVVRYADLPNTLWHCDVALIPFTDTAFTSSPEPIKLYEYAAAGLPIVVGSFMRDHACASRIHVVGPDLTYVSAIEQALVSGILESEDQGAILAGARWADRLGELDAVLEAAR